MATSTQQTTSEGSKRTAKRSSTKKRKSSSRRKVQARSSSRGGMTSQLYRQGRDAMSDAYDTVSKAGKALPGLPEGLHLRSRGQSIFAMMEERPLVMGAVGLGVGMVLAALIPSFTHTRSR